MPINNGLSGHPQFFHHHFRSERPDGLPQTTVQRVYVRDVGVPQHGQLRQDHFLNNADSLKGEYFSEADLVVLERQVHDWVNCYNLKNSKTKKAYGNTLKKSKINSLDRFDFNLLSKLLC